MILIDKSDNRQRGLARLILAQSSIGLARRAAQHVAQKMTSQNDALFAPLEAAVVVCYNRPFAGGGGQIPDRYSRISDPELQWLHRSLCEHRDQFIAHSDEDLHKVKFFHPGRRRRIRAGKLEGEILCGEEVTGKTLSLAAFPVIVRLCDYQLDRLRVEIEEGKGKVRRIQLYPD